MARQTFLECFRWTTSDATAIANTTTETAMFAAPTIPADYMQDGRLLRIRAFGKLSTTGTPTLKIRARWGAAVSGVLLALSDTLTMGSGVSNAVWELELYIQTRTNGSAGTAIAFGTLRIMTGAGTVVQSVFGVAGWQTPATATCDFTAATSLTLSAEWGTASSSNTLTGQVVSVEALN